MERSYVNYELAPLNDEEELSGFGKADVDLTPPKCRQFASLVQLVRLRLVIIIFVVLLANLALLLIFLQLKLHLFISNSARELQTGDSYSSIEFDPFGELPEPSNPLGNPPYPGNSRDRLPNWVAWLTTQFNKTTSVAYDFAISGAAVEEAIVWGEVVRGYVDQVDDYILSTQNNTQSPSNPLFISWIGINDLVLNHNMTHSMNILFEKAETLYSHGAREFVYFNLPPLYRTPADSSGWYELSVHQWNIDLIVNVDAFHSRHEDIKVSIYDAFSLFNRVLDNPRMYGFNDSTCIGSKDGCIWYDNFHPGSAFYKVLAEDIAMNIWEA